MTPIEELQRERAGYVLRGLKDRVAQVDACIAALGGKPTDDTPRVVEAAAKSAPRKR